MMHWIIIDRAQKYTVTVYFCFSRIVVDRIVIVWYISGYMRGLGITPKQRRYAHNLMNTDLSRAEAMRQAGYSKTSAEHPAKIENSNGFKLAMAGLFAQSGNVGMSMLNEIDARINAGELQKVSTKDLVGFFDVMTKAMERMIPKEKAKSSEDLLGAFGRVIDVEPEKPLETKDETASTLDSVASDDVIDTTS